MIKFQTVYFLIAVAVGSFGMQHLTAMAETNHEEYAAIKAEKKPTILGHRIGPNGQEMLVVR
ncbi:hypothetical protein [Pseudomonas phage D6]|nr:hypothetical protein [Pseudomonas phage D6]